MGYVLDSRVDDYLDGLPAWQREIGQQVRDLVHSVDPELTETVKRGGQPYFVLQGNVCALLAARDHVNVFVYDGGIVDDPAGLVTGGHENSTARTIAIHEGEDLRVPELIAFIAQIVADNRAGGWRKLKRDGRAATQKET